MIIQHNLMSLNAHRQLGGNTNLVSKNLEKLSSGYKINRAGDDAAGLAISEKMRAQITGLTRAQSNAQDGISLVQTAEGALTEVHSMLNRMVDLATQSSNGTMQGDDRQKIQDEMDALTDEIDRISKSTNFNGINLLDGSLGGAKVAATAGATVAGPAKASTGITAGNAKTAAGVDGDAAEKATYTYNFTGKTALTGVETIIIAGKTYTGAADDTGNNIDVATHDTMEKQLTAIAAKLGADAAYKDEWNVTATATGITFTAKVAGAADGADGQPSAADVTAIDAAVTGTSGLATTAPAGAGKVAGADGTKGEFEIDLTGFDVTDKTKASTVTIDIGGSKLSVDLEATKGSAAEVAAAMDGKEYTIDDQVFVAAAGTGGDVGKVTFEAKVAGASAVPADDTVVKATAAEASTTTAGTSTISFKDQPTYGSTLEVGGKTFEFVKDAKDVTAGNVAVVVGATADASVKALHDAMTANAPDDVTLSAYDAAKPNEITLTNADATDASAAPTITQAGVGLVLQIGDTADTFNKVSVSVADMGVKGLGIDAIDVGLQGVSSDAIKTIKDAIETVSVNRSAMGALQNRLEHTINNLGVASENMTAAESRVRDVDMAKEMMTFTKNNVLTQAAQAMLAQANQQPQQVLQLLR